jgi:HAD superfamily hydrolase (TIGR01484 family)
MEKVYTKMTKYKLLAIDLDGTLLSKLKQISKSNLEALKEYIDDGGKPVITTGRSIVSVNRIVNKIDKAHGNKSEYAICFNGAYIKNFHTGEIIEKKIPDKTVREIYQYVKDNKVIL